MKQKLQLIIILCLSAFYANAQMTPTDYLTGISSPRGLAFDANGILYVAENTSGNIFKVTGPETYTTFASTGSYNNNIAFDDNGNLYTGDDFFGRIFKIDASGNQEEYLNSTNNNVSDPWAIEFDTNGNLYYSSSTSGNIVKVTPSKVSTNYATGFFTPEGMAFDSAGNLYVADRNDQILFKIDPSGTVTTVLSGISEIRAVAVDANDKVYFNQRIGFSTRKIVKYDPVDESQTDIVDSGITGSVSEIAFDANGDMFFTGADKVSKVSNVVALSTTDFSINNTFNIYPNPAKNIINVSNKVASYKIFDLTGKKLIDGYNTTNIVDISSLPNGLYMVSLQDKKGNNTTKKLIKK